MQNTNQVPGVVSHQVYGSAAAAAVAAGLATRGVFFAFDPYPGDYFQFTVKDEGDNGEFLASLLPAGRPYAVTLTNAQGSTTDTVNAMSPAHAVELAAEQRHARENGAFGHGQLRNVPAEGQTYSYAVTTPDGRPVSNGTRQGVR
jgi:hypothetical protein